MPLFRPLLLASLLAAFAASAQVTAQAASGATYLVTAKGPIQEIKSGEKTLGLSYQTEAPNGPARIDDEASDLMSSLLPELELGHYQAAVIMADTQPAGFILKTSQSYHTVYQRSPSGEWLLVKEGVANPELRARLEEAYARADAAFKTSDDSAIRDLCTSDYSHRLANGAVRTLDQELVAAKASLPSISAWTTAPGGWFKRNDRAFVVTTQTRTGEVQAPAGQAVRVTRATTSFDTWVLSAAAPKLSRSVDVEEKNVPAL